MYGMYAPSAPGSPNVGGLLMVYYRPKNSRLYEKASPALGPQVLDA